jgi:hypothetical protein
VISLNLVLAGLRLGLKNRQVLITRTILNKKIPLNAIISTIEKKILTPC